MFLTLWYLLFFAFILIMLLIYIEKGWLSWMTDKFNQLCDKKPTSQDECILKLSEGVKMVTEAFVYEVEGKVLIDDSKESNFQFYLIHPLMHYWFLSYFSPAGFQIYK